LQHLFLYLTPAVADAWSKVISGVCVFVCLSVCLCVRSI